jgi:hypothetical protein
MRPSNKQRSRNKPGNNTGHNNNNQRRSMGNIINRVFESAGPDGKVRGTPQQIIDKYQALARDAQVAGDRVSAESFLQHSEHYSRLLGEAQRHQAENRFASSGQQDREDGQRGGDGQQEEQERQPQQQQPHQHQPHQHQPQQHQPRQEQSEPPVASGLTMIEPEDSFDSDGPVETPEGRRQPREDRAAAAQVDAPAMAPNGSEHPVAAPGAAGEAPAGPTKRPRPRRRARPEGGEAPVQAE